MHLQSRPPSLQSHGGCRPDDPAAHLGDHQGGGGDDDLCVKQMILIFQLI